MKPGIPLRRPRQTKSRTLRDCNPISFGEFKIEIRPPAGWHAVCIVPFSGRGGSMRGAMKRKVVLFALCLAAAIVPGIPADKPKTPKTKPLQVAAVASFDQEYRLGAEDLIEVFVWKEPDLTMTVAVRPDGKISLPLTNEIQAGGQT